MSRGGIRHPKYAPLTLVFLSVTGIMLALTLAESTGITSFSGSRDTARPVPSATPQRTPESRSSPPGNPQQSPTSSPYAGAPTVSATDASEDYLWAVDLTLAGKSSDLRVPASADVRGRKYTRSIVFTCPISCVAETASVSVVAPTGRTRLVGSAGVLDSAPTHDEAGTFTLAFDGDPVWTFEVEIGEPEAFDLPVTPGTRVTFTASRPGSATNPILVGAGAAVGKELTTPHLAWLDPSFAR